MTDREAIEQFEKNCEVCNTMDNWYSMHWCGGTWVWCDGACGTCTMWQFTTSDHTEIAAQICGR